MPRKLDISDGEIGNSLGNVLSLRRLSIFNFLFSTVSCMCVSDLEEILRNFEILRKIGVRALFL